MRLEFNRFKHIVRERLALELFREADDKKKSKDLTSSESKNANEYKEKWEKLGATFKCPRHGLPLLTHMVRASYNQNIAPDDPRAVARAAAMQLHGNIQPPTKDFADLLIKQSRIFGTIPDAFYCPLRDQDAIKGAENRKVFDADGNFTELPDMYEVWTAVDDLDANGNLQFTIDPNTKKKKKLTKMAKVARQCDYFVGGKWQKPGQISRKQWLEEFENEPSKYRAFGVVAQEMENAGDFKRSKPLRSDDYIKQTQSATRPETAPKPLVDKIKEMEKENYHYAYIRPSEAADKVVEFIKSNNITGIKSVGFSDDGKSIDVITIGSIKELISKFKTELKKTGKEGETDISKLSPLGKHAYDVLQSWKKFQNFNAAGMPINLYGADDKGPGIKKAAKGGTASIDVTDPQYREKLKALAGSRQNADGTRDSGMGKLVKVKLERTADGKPIFTERDVWYLSSHLPKSLSDAKAKAGDKYLGPAPYYGVKRDHIEQLLRNMGWEMAASETRGPDEKDQAPMVGGAKSFKPEWVDDKGVEQTGIPWAKQTHDSVADSDGDLDDDHDDIAATQAEIETAKKLINIAKVNKRPEALKKAELRLAKANRDLADYRELNQSRDLRKFVQSQPNEVGIEQQDTIEPESEQKSEDDDIDDLIKDLEDEK